ncbi:hypothetical protein NPIL_72711 [Nephila pilipes]|uniref:Uncharacterized protein n=1 Tax=Nephila pilipes TaxID=299642 RepID=A0A8X6U1F5_NEPPI|nr:hypothetical protein NPIL_72711 [Nephila pilipes]
MDSVNSIPMTQLVKEYQQNVWQKVSVPRAFSSCRKDGALMGEPGVAKGYGTDKIIDEYSFSSCTMADWRQFINEIIVDYVEETSETIGGVGEFLFRASCEEKGIDTFNTFLELVRKIDWTNFTYAD